MDSRLSRALRVGALAALAVVATASGAGADASSPSAALRAPSHVVGGTTFFVRSDDPCPQPDGRYEIVRVALQPAGAPAGDPAGVDLGKGTQGWVNDDGSWEVVLTAPSLPVDQPTVPFTIQAACLAHKDPYYVNPDPSAPVDNEKELVALQRYFAQPIWSTAVGGYEHSADSVDSTASSSATTTTTVTNGATTTTLPTTPTTVAPSSRTSEAPIVIGKARPDDEAARAAEARDELALHAVHQHSAQDVALAAAQQQLPAPASDASLPWWAFVAAVILAVGAVIGYGVKRAG